MFNLSSLRSSVSLGPCYAILLFSCFPFSWVFFGYRVEYKIRLFPSGSSKFPFCQPSINPCTYWGTPSDRCFRAWIVGSSSSPSSALSLSVFCCKLFVLDPRFRIFPFRILVPFFSFPVNLFLLCSSLVLCGMASEWNIIYSPTDKLVSRSWP